MDQDIEKWKEKIPAHWEVKRLGEVCKLKNGFAFKSNNYVEVGIPIIRISDINDGNVTYEKSVRISENKNYNDYIVIRDDILIAMSGATTGKFGVYKNNEIAYQNQRVGKFEILDKKILSNQFLYHQINALKRRIEKDAYGGAQPNISSTKIEQMYMVLPPLAEQQAIVAKIEELFSELENGKEQLLIAQKQLKVYRQSLLQAAFSGKLTHAWSRLQEKSQSTKEFIFSINNGRKLDYDQKLSMWSKNNINSKNEKIPKPKKPSNLDPKNYIMEGLVDLKNIPSQWTVVPLVFVSDNNPNSIVDGPFGSSINVNEDYIEKGIPVIRMINIRPLKFIPDQMKFIKESKFESFKRHNILPGDVLIAKVGATIGDCCVYPDNQPEAMLSTTGSCRIRIDKSIMNGKFLEYYICYHKNSLKDIASQTAQPFLNMEVVKSFPVVLPFLPEQEQIVEILESKLTVCEKMEETIRQSLAQVEVLRQSILKKAFEGRLV